MKLYIEISLGRKYSNQEKKLSAAYPHCICDSVSIHYHPGNVVYGGFPLSDERITLTWKISDDYEEMASQIQLLDGTKSCTLQNFLFERDTFHTGADIVLYNLALIDLEMRKDELMQYLPDNADFEEFFQILTEVKNALCLYDKKGSTHGSADCKIDYYRRYPRRLHPEEEDLIVDNAIAEYKEYLHNNIESWVNVESLLLLADAWDEGKIRKKLEREIHKHYNRFWINHTAAIKEGKQKGIKLSKYSVLTWEEKARECLDNAIDELWEKLYPTLFKSPTVNQ